jgi:crotonobetainyl-CoA:carnitine CoA-transferase CaiB-like acyl-CoA transferase
MAQLDDRGVHGLITSRCVDGHCYRRYHRDLRAVFARRMRWFPSIPGMTIYGERFWPVVCAVLGLTETTDDPRFATPEAREANRRELITIFDEAFARITYPDWERAVHKHGLIATRVNELTDLATDEQILANEYIQPG